MEGVAIVGAGQTRYGDFPDLSIKEMFLEAYQEMLKSVDKGLDPDVIEAAYVGTIGSGGFQLGQAAPLLTGYVGLPHIPAVRVENACASGGFALLEAIHAVASGRYQVVLAAGIEKMRDVSAGKTKYWLGVSGDTEYERLAGLTFAGIYATIARRYMEEYGMKKEHLSMVAVKNHRHGVHNPKAQFRREIDIETAVKAPNVAYPLNLFDCCSTTDGAAVVLVVNARIARRFTDSPVEIIGFGAASDHLAIQDRENITGLLAASEAARQAYSQAGVSPQDIDLAEVHDCFTIAEILAYEDLGFCPRGHGYKILEEGQTGLGGRIPVNVSGGLKSKGHPLGATGIGQAYEVFKQLRGQADKPARQVPNAEIALSHNVGGSGGTAVVCIYKKGGQ
ncbi:3-ketoacyl-CoA thiolase [Clostridiales bacterium PH28_bin88]|nr:3-ketoacyl-CoA thiolase [Clostridiales bacterium PH28_bin88]